MAATAQAPELSDFKYEAHVAGSNLARKDDVMADFRVIDTKLGPLRPNLSKLTLDEKGAYYNERYDSGNAAALDCGLCAISIEVHFTSFDEAGREVFNKYGFSKWRQSTLRGSQKTFWRLKKAAKEHQRLESIQPSGLDKPNIAFDVFTYLERQEEPDQAGPELAAVARDQVYIRAEAGEEVTKEVAMAVMSDVKKKDEENKRKSKEKVEREATVKLESKAR